MNNLVTSPLNLVQREGQQAFTTSLIVAQGCDNRSHKSTIQLVRKYEDEMNTLGQRVTFQMLPLETSGQIAQTAKGELTC